MTAVQESGQRHDLEELERRAVGLAQLSRRCDAQLAQRVQQGLPPTAESERIVRIAQQADREYDRVARQIRNHPDYPGVG